MNHGSATNVRNVCRRRHKVAEQAVQSAVDGELGGVSDVLAVLQGRAQWLSLRHDGAVKRAGRQWVVIIEYENVTGAPPPWLAVRT